MHDIALALTSSPKFRFSHLQISLPYIKSDTSINTYVVVLSFAFLFEYKISIASARHGGNPDDSVSIPAMMGTEVVVVFELASFT